LRREKYTNFEDKVELLTQLGLTPRQARVYLALASSSPCTVNQISKLSGIATETVYRILPKLQEKSLTERILTSPTKFSATRMKIAIEMLLKQKNQEVTKIRNKAKEIIANSDCDETQLALSLQKEGTQLVTVSGKEAVIKKLRKSLQEAKASVDVITAQTRFSQAILEFASDYKKALKRKVKIRIATEKHAPEKAALKIVDALSDKPGFQVRYFPQSPDAIVTIVDNKEAFMALSATAFNTTTSSVWSNNTSFIGLAKNYFETKWEISKDFFMEHVEQQEKVCSTKKSSL
jgi:sugar-specific transcriptional regulator TrmB